MSKTKRVWCCTTCGHNEPKWVGQCKACEEWNTFHEEVEVDQTETRYESSSNERPVPISQIPPDNQPRLQTGLSQFDRLVGGGVVKGAFTLVGGDPGIGKSTLLLQVANALALKGLVVLYVSAEESVNQTALRASRLGVTSDNLLILSQTRLSAIKQHVEKCAPDVLIVDSIQIIYKDEISSAPGSVAQVRECAMALMHLAKKNEMATFVIGHVTKTGEIAGPRVLEHLVDTVLYFEGDKEHHFRLLRSTKNRFGPTDEVALFQMEGQGLVSVANPSSIFLEERQRGGVGQVVAPTIEGSRPILVEVQALVVETSFSTPTRRAIGVDGNRLQLLLAVLQKRSGFGLYNCDVFVSIAGGLKVFEPALDLALVMAIVSSFRNRPLDATTLAFGEVGLGGEVRSVPRTTNRLKEGAQLGFKKAILPTKRLEALPKEIKTQIECVGVNRVEEAIDVLFN